MKRDIVIVGAGMVGAALACKLSQDNPALRITLLEAQHFQPSYTPTTFDSRVVAITAASQQFLDNIGIWSIVRKHRLCAYTGMEVWDGEGTGHIYFDCREVGESALGYIVENSIIVEALLEQLKQSSVEWRCPAKVSAINLPTGKESALVILDDGSTFESTLIIATDGANSVVRQLANLETREWSYDHTAIICTVQTEKPHGHVARQIFTRFGPLAFLPLQTHDGDTHFCSIVWSAQTEYARSLLNLNDLDFSHTLAEAFENKLGNIVSLTPRHHFPLQQRHCKDYFKPGLVVAGDAAHTIHPLAGQGVNLGLQDVVVLADEIHRASQRHIPLSDVSILKRYQRRRKGPNLAMMGAMEGFKQLFSQKELPFQWLRNEGMNQIARIPFVKRRLMREAMGLK
jgi:2-octaprenylphenol hydroxylase